MIKIRMTKLIKIPIIQVSFMYMLNISAIKSIKTSLTTIVKITDRNAGMQNDLNCQIARIRKMSAKLFKTFPNFCEILLKQLFWTLDVEKCRTTMANIAKTHILLVKKKPLMLQIVTLSGMIEK